MENNYRETLMGEAYKKFDIEEDALFFYTCLDLCIMAMVEAELEVLQWMYERIEYEDEIETMFLFTNKASGSNLRIKVTHNNKYYAEIKE